VQLQLETMNEQGSEHTTWCKVITSAALALAFLLYFSAIARGGAGVTVPPPSFFPQKVKSGLCRKWGMTLPGSTPLICWTFFSHSEMLPSGICTLGKLILVMPATNAVSEHSFSALKQVQTYLRLTTGEGRLNHLMLLHVHKELADGIDMVVVANLFVGDNQRRKHCFGSFQKTTFRWSVHLPLRQLRQFNNYKLTMTTLKGETFAGFKIQRQSVFYFLIHVASVILSSMCIGLQRQCRK